MMYRPLACLFLACTLVCGADAQPQAAFPLWDGQESIEHYAKRTNLPPAKALDLGNGVKLELLLIPAGKFIMGTPEPQPVDEDGFHKKIVLGKAVLAAGGGILLVLICTAILRTIRKKTRFQYSLRRFMAMIFALSLAVLGGMHWWFSAKALSQAQAEYSAALARFKEAEDSEKPAHEVTLTTPFYMAKFLTTQEQYQQVMGTNPSWFKGPKLPVEQVSWDEPQEFCKKVTERTAGVSPALTKAGGTPAVRLPTEAEWEYACRAGTTTAYYTGDAEADLGRAAWYWANSKLTTHPVGQKEPNALGLYDMHGNVWEWCADWYGAYAAGAVTDPKGAADGATRVLRGGSWSHVPSHCPCARRYHFYPGFRSAHFGFRVVVGCVVSRTP
ncbi:MAG: formylglycine-generating enzyme family protein [Planctomycetota bacterium]